jgi:hypothetical protein
MNEITGGGDRGKLTAGDCEQINLPRQKIVYLSAVVSHQLSVAGPRASISGLLMWT